MRQSIFAAFPFLRSFATVFPAVALVVASLVSCETNETASMATQAPVPAHGYTNPSDSGGTPAAYQPVDANGQTAQVPGPTPILFNGFGVDELDEANKPNITAKAAILVDARGRVLFEKNADTRLPCASTQKLLLGILVAERGNLSAPVTITDEDTWAEPTKMGIKAGQVYTRAELLHAVLVRSSNDIANALGRDHSGSIPAFVANMNQKARSLGMYDSHFTNAHGLPSPPGQYSTARDLAKLGAAALRNPTVRRSVGTKSTIFRFSDGTTKTCNNTNQVLRHFPYCTGLKTGYTNAAGRCLVSSATANGRSVIAVILGSTSPTVWEESEALLKYGLKM